jgi:hypothetical protein
MIAIVPGARRLQLDLKRGRRVHSLVFLKEPRDYEYIPGNECFHFT